MKHLLRLLLRNAVARNVLPRASICNIFLANSKVFKTLENLKFFSHPTSIVAFTFRNRGTFVLFLFGQM